MLDFVHNSHAAATENPKNLVARDRRTGRNTRRIFFRRRPLGDRIARIRIGLNEGCIRVGFRSGRENNRPIVLILSRAPRGSLSAVRLQAKSLHCLRPASVLWENHFHECRSAKSPRVESLKRCRIPSDSWTVDQPSGRWRFAMDRGGYPDS
jgi:hypothetical protein